MKKTLSLILAALLLVCFMLPMSAHEGSEYIVTATIDENGIIKVPNLWNYSELGNVTVRVSSSLLNGRQIVSIANYNSQCIINTSISGEYHEYVDGTHTLWNATTGEFRWDYTSVDTYSNGHDHTSIISPTIVEMEYSGSYSWACDESCNDGTNYTVHKRIYSASGRVFGYADCINP